MRLTKTIILFLLFSFIQSFGQDWISEYLNNNPDKMDNIVYEIGNEMAKEIGNNAPELNFHIIENDSIKKLSDYKGDVVIVNFWSTNCSGCLMQVPELSKLHNEYNDEGLKVILIANDNKDSLYKYYRKYKTEGIKATMEAKDIKYLKRPYQFFAKPTAFLVDGTGIIRDAWIGPESYDSLEKRILPFLPKN